MRSTLQTRILAWIMAPLILALAVVVGTAVARDYGYGAQPASLIGAESLIGMDVQNPQGEKLGEIDEIVLDRDRSRIVYAVVASGGFLGFGERNVAVPWHAFQMPAGTADSTSDTMTPGSASSGSPSSGSTGMTSSTSQGSRASSPSGSSQPGSDSASKVGDEAHLWRGDHLVLDVDKEALKQAEFDTNGTWPAMANAELFQKKTGAGMQNDPSPQPTTTDPNRSSSGSTSGSSSTQDRNRQQEDPAKTAPGEDPGRKTGHEPGKSPGHDPNRSPGHARDQQSGQSGQTDTGATSSKGAYGQLATVPDDPDFWSYKLSKLINMNVSNTQGEEIGEIEKILIDGKEGRIAFATLSTESYLEVGNRLATVEWNTVTVDPGNDRITIEADRETLNRLAFIEGESDPALTMGASASSSASRVASGSTSYGTSAGGQGLKTQLVDSDELLGIQVKSRSGEDLGEVEEIVLAREHEDIAYAVVALGGALGMGEKKVAVPWHAFELAGDGSTSSRSMDATGTPGSGSRSTTSRQSTPPDPGRHDPSRQNPDDRTTPPGDEPSRDERDETRSQNPAYGTTQSTERMAGTTHATKASGQRISHLILDVDKARLEQAAFEDDGTWPESADGALFGQRGMQRQSTGQTGTRQEPGSGTGSGSTGSGSSSTATQRGTTQQQQQQQQHMARGSRSGGDRTTVPSDPHFWSYKLSKLKDLDLQTAQGEDLGDIEKIVVDTREGRLAYVILSTGDLLGDGDRMAMVPWRVVSISTADERMIVTSDRQTLQAAAFREGEEPDLNDPLVAQRIEGAFGVGSSDESSQVFGRPTTGTATTGIERFGTLDFNRTQTVKGTVRNVDRARPDEMMIVIDTDQGKTVKVFAGPSDYAQKQGMNFAQQSTLTVVGVPAKTSGQEGEVIVAKEIRSGSQTLILFDNQGNPRWKSDPRQPSSTQQQQQNPSDMNKKQKDDDKDDNKDD